jgi:hypothetical protein
VPILRVYPFWSGGGKNLDTSDGARMFAAGARRVALYA